jgi:hypothetical protein
MELITKEKLDELLVRVSQIERRTASAPAGEICPVGSFVTRCLAPEFRAEERLTRSG